MDTAWPPTTRMISVKLLATYDPGDVSNVPPPTMMSAFRYGGSSGSITEKAPLRAPKCPAPYVVHSFFWGSYPL